MIKFTLFASHESIAKSITSFDPYQSSSPNFNGATYLAVHDEVESLAQFADRINEVKDDGRFAIAFGITDQPEINVKPSMACGPNDVARTRDNFKYPDKNAILMIDIDGIDNFKSIEDTLKPIFDSIEGLDQYSYVWTPSGSAMIEDQQGAIVRGVAGVHVYFVVDRGNMVQSCGDIIWNRLVLNGHGYIKISNAGTQLVRSLVDRHIATPEHLDFISSARVPDGYKSTRKAEYVGKGKEVVPSSIFNVLTTDENDKLQAIIADLKGKSAPALEQKQSEIKRNITDPVQRESYDRLWSDNKLTPGFKIMLESGDVVDVSDILADMDKYKNTPVVCIETGRIGCAKLLRSKKSGGIFYHSFARGGTSFDLTKRATINWPTASKTPNDIAAILGRHLAKSDQFFSRSNTLGFIKNDRLVFATSDYRDMANFEYLKQEINDDHAVIQKSKSMDVYDNVLTALIANADRYLPEIKDVIKSPVISHVDGSITGMKAGYDRVSKNYFQHNIDFDDVDIDQIKTKEEAQEAIEWLMKPFELYRYINRMNYHIALGAVLTALFGSFLPIKPMVGIATTVQGNSSGKTPFVNGIMALTGYRQSTSRWETSAEEQKKSLFAHLLTKPDSCIYWDNIQNGLLLSNPTLAMALTSPTIDARKLGQSLTCDVSTNVPYFFSVNGFVPNDDLAVRSICVRIEDSNGRGVIAPKTPAEIVNDMGGRVAFLKKAFQLIRYYFRAYSSDDVVKQLNGYSSHAGKFPHWTALVQAPIFVITGHNILTDSINRMKESPDSDAANILNEIVELIHNRFKNNPFTSKMVEQAISEEYDLKARYDRFIKESSFNSFFMKHVRMVGTNSGGRYGGFIIQERAQKYNGYRSFVLIEDVVDDGPLTDVPDQAPAPVEQSNIKVMTEDVVDDPVIAVDQERKYRIARLNRLLSTSGEGPVH